MIRPPPKEFLAQSDRALNAITFLESFPKTVTLVAHGTRCGKPTCRCTRGQLHPTHYLRWREGTVQRRRYVRAAEVPAVRAMVEQREEQHRAEQEPS